MQTEMTNRNHNSTTRRKALKLFGASGLTSIAGCLGENATDASESDLSPKSDAVTEWGERVNEHARQAGIDWTQHEGTALTFGMNVHPFTETVKPLLPYFEELTGITVQFQTFPEDQLWQKLTLDLNNETGVYDGFFLGLWPSARYHDAGWVTDYNQFIDDGSLTDSKWLALDDYPQAALEAFTYGDDDFIAMPIGIEAYGCLAYDVPTMETLGLDVPESYPELLNAAKTIHESDEVDRDGITSRASSTPLSSANWATVFKSYDAEWVDYETREATLNSQQGIDSLEMFTSLMGSFGPGDIGTYDWYKTNQAFGNGNVGMTLHTPSTVGVFSDEQLERTEWVPPLPGPNGTQSAATWQWALGISQFSTNPEAAWLFIQWATSREMMVLTNTQQWDGQPVYGPARSNWLFEQDEFIEKGPKESWRNAHRTGMEMVPTNPPPVPLHTPQNMDIMSEAAIAMNAAVTDNKSAKASLETAVPPITNYAKEIPSTYLQ